MLTFLPSPRLTQYTQRGASPGKMKERERERERERDRERERERERELLEPPVPHDLYIHIYMDYSAVPPLSLSLSLSLRARRIHVINPADNDDMFILFICMLGEEKSAAAGRSAAFPWW